MKGSVEVAFEKQSGLRLHVSVASSETPGGEKINVSIAGLMLLVQVGDRHYQANLETLVTGIVEQDLAAREELGPAGSEG